jgi:hypothetical protein
MLMSIVIVRVAAVEDGLLGREGDCKEKGEENEELLHMDKYRGLPTVNA